MPVRRYRRVEDVPPPDRAPTPEAGVAAACSASAVSAALGAIVPAPRGVRRFRSVEAADADRRAREIAAMRATASRRAAGTSG